MNPFLAALSLIVLYSSLAWSQDQSSKFHEWIDQGPGGKEHSMSWVDQQNYYLVNGFGFTPFQGVNSNELWKLDLASKKWELLAVKGDSPGPYGRGAKWGDKNELLVLAYDPVFFGAQSVSLLYKLKIENGVGQWTKVSYYAETQEEAADAEEFQMRDSRLSSLVYNSNDGHFYSVCAAANCDIFKIKLLDNKSKVFKIKSANSGPSGRIGFAYGFSQTKNELIIASGQNLLSPTAAFFNDIWVLQLNNNAPTWQLTSATLEGRRNACYGFNENTQKLSVWGGTHDGRSSIKGINTFDLTTQKLTVKENANEGFERSSCFSAYDSVGKRLFMGFGNTMINNQNIVFRDLWVSE